MRVGVVRGTVGRVGAFFGDCAKKVAKGRGPRETRKCAEG